MAMVGGIFYGLLTQTITHLLGFSSELTVIAAFIVFFFYLVSRFLLLFCGIHTPYYSKGGKTSPFDLYENTHFYQTAQWVGKFYHYHDIALFVFLFLFSISFLISLGVDGWSKMPFGRTAQDLWNSLIPTL
jgi:hypothetical protein